MFLPSNITLKFGDSGDFVAEMQRRLAAVRHFSEGNINGFFDGPTTNAVISFQSTQGLHADGVAGPETLRRLNGVIAGDTSSTDKKEEEAKAAAAQTLTNDIMQMPHGEAAYNPGIFAPQAAAHTPYGEEAYAAQAAPEITPQQPAAPAVNEQQRINEELVRQQAQPAHGSDLLAQMLLQNTPPAPQHAAAPTQHERPPVQPVAIKAEIPQAGFGDKAAAVPPAHTPDPQTLAPQAAAPEQPKGLVGKAMQMASGLMQKLHDHFQSKLAPSVLEEVKSIGLTMAQSGMKEAPIPTGPEMPTRTPDLPARAPAPAPQRN